MLKMVNFTALESRPLAQRVPKYCFVDRRFDPPGKIEATTFFSA